MFLYGKLKKLKKNEKIAERKQEILREKEVFVLDNSLRESTVGQLRGHTIENKWKIYEQVKKCIHKLSKNVWKTVKNSFLVDNFTKTINNKRSPTNQFVFNPSKLFS